DHLRKQTWRNLLAQILPFSQIVDNNDSTAEQPPEPEFWGASDTLASFEAQRLALEFESALKKLPDRQQQAYLLRQWQGLSVNETADIMNCSNGTVKTHLSRAMQSLKEQLGEWLNDEI
ncbi:MAG: sigma-70 family RNA polymerase sigma factor, partial [Thiohalomonadales bacterium]